MNSINLDNHPIYSADIKTGTSGYLCRKECKPALLPKLIPITSQYSGHQEELSPESWLGQLLSTSFLYKGLLYKTSLEPNGYNMVKIKLEIL